MNVIVLVNDSYRMDHVGCYNNVLPTVKYPSGKVAASPSLDKLAKESAVFTHAFPENLPTLPCRTSLFTGKYNFPFRGWGKLDNSEIVLAEVLWNQGYKSCLVTDTYHMHKPTFGYERGFDEVVFIRGQEEDPVALDTSIPVDVTGHYKCDAEGKDKRQRAQIEQYLRNIKDWGPTDEDHFSAQVIKNAISWLERQAKKDNIFLWVDAFDPHEPWDPPAPYDTMYTDPNFKGTPVTHPIPGFVEGYMTPAEVQHTKALYAGECTMTDKWDGIFFDALRNMGMLDNTLLIFLSDHGAPFGEHGIIRKAKPYPYEELVRVPFMVRHPEGLGAGKQYNQLVQTCDVAPTILDFLGVDRRHLRYHGENILPLITGEKEKIRDYAYVGHFNQSVRINDHEWAYIKWMSEKGRKSELYRYAEDKEMKNDVADQHAERAQAMELEMRRFVGSLGLGWS